MVRDNHYISKKFLKYAFLKKKKDFIIVKNEAVYTFMIFLYRRKKKYQTILSSVPSLLVDIETQVS